MERELASKLVNALRSAGINFVTYLPETRLSQILPLRREDSFFQLAPVASEAEGVSIAAGASLGGKQVACYMEGTGVFVSTYNLLTLAERFGAPMLLLVSYVGSVANKRNGFHLDRSRPSLLQSDHRGNRVLHTAPSRSRSPPRHSQSHCQNVVNYLSHRRVGCAI